MPRQSNNRRRNNNQSNGGGFRSRSRYGNNRNRSRKKNTLNPQMLIKKAIIKEVKENDHVPSFIYQELDIHNELKQNVLAKGFTTPTPIQEEAIPHVIQGKDLVGIANTGTGKTGAFLIPAINKIAYDKEQRLLVIAPTRELAEQIEHDAYILTKNLRLRSLVVVGGMNINSQIGKLRGNPHIIVGTPGRLLDLIERGVLNLSKFQTVVLDEVDRMLDMGFVDDVKKIIAQLPAQRQSLFFSATMTKQIEAIINIFAPNAVNVSVKTHETSDNVHQDIIEVNSSEEKLSKLLELLDQENVAKAIVFMRTKRGVQKLDDILYEKGKKVGSIHGDKSQPQRKRSLDAFKTGRINILVATDVAARGLDVKDISHVINYDMPESYEDYTHRIGRTGRASNIGYAFTFVEKYR